jgi:Potassium-transporting ATPase A subunit/K+-transporting ATPase, c chain
MPSGSASLITRATFEPPPVSCCHRLRWLEPMTIWVIWCSWAKRAMARAGSSSWISCQRAPTSAASSCSFPMAGRSAGLVASLAATCTTSRSALSRDAIRAARRIRASVPGADAKGNPLPRYFQPRPSNAGTGYDASSSGASNLGPSNPLLTGFVAGVNTVGLDGRPSAANPFATRVDPACVPTDPQGNPVTSPAPGQKYAKTAGGEYVCDPNAYASVAQNNGSAFAGLAANTPWYDTTLGLTMLIGRFAPIVLALAIAGSLAGARVHARTRATLDTAGPTFVAFLLGVIVIVGGLIYFPMLILGPIGERIVG